MCASRPFRKATNDNYVGCKSLPPALSKLIMVNKNPIKLKEYRKKYRRVHRERLSEYQREWGQKLRMKALEVYGGNPPRCNCCGEKELIFLSIDHIEGGGTKHRKSLSTTSGLYAWLKKNNYPPGFQVLCMNCNWGRYRNDGICPHKVVCVGRDSLLLSTTPL
jgi:hypothetical protein